ncbi:hypothetical protein M1146_04370 [Patescibacteria group bacterium]|nr:hypothetical protein [Patescibacteria group bacterium]
MRLTHSTLETQSEKFDAKIAKWVFKIADKANNNNSNGQHKNGKGKRSNESGSGHNEAVGFEEKGKDNEFTA